MPSARDFPPRLMPAPQAAHYLGVSVTKFRALDIPSKRHGGNVMWDRHDLDSWADALPYRDGKAGQRIMDSAGAAAAGLVPKKWATG